MKKILLQVQHPVFANNSLFTTVGMNDMSSHWRALKTRLGALGYDIMTADNHKLDDCAWIWFLDTTSVDGLNRNPKWPVRNLYQEAMEKNLGDRLVLFLWEGAVVNPDNYKKRVWDKFKHVFTWNDDLVNGKKFLKFCLPTPIRPQISNPTSFKDKKLLVNMSHNRYFRGKNELFSKRRKSSIYLCKNYPNDFDLFGGRWGKPITRLQRLLPWLVPQIQCYRGIAQNKIETFSKYKFALCYENMAETRGYVTEKIFDTLQAGTVPIYWGAPNIEDYVDKDAFIDRRNFANDSELAKYLMNVTEIEHQKMVTAGKKYLQSERLKKFLPEGFCDQVIQGLNLRPRN